MTAPNSEQLVKQRDLIPLFGLFLSVVLFGITSIAYGYIPFSPIFCVHHTGVAMAIYALFFTSLWSYEMRFSQHSARPDREEDNHHPFWLYMGTLTLWLGMLIPNFWFILGNLLSRGVSLDRSLYQSMNIWVCCFLLGLLVWRIRHWAHEYKDITRVNRVSPPRYTEVRPAIIQDDSYEWNPISPLGTSPEFAESFNDHYQKRRLQKLEQDAQDLTALKALSDYGIRSIAKSSRIRRSTGDYDTRFDPYPPEFDQYSSEFNQIELNDLTLYQADANTHSAPSTEEPPPQIEPSREESERLEGSDTLVMSPQLDLVDELTQHLTKEDIAIWEEVNDIL